MKIFIYTTLALGVVRAIADYQATKTKTEKFGVLVVIAMFISSMFFVYKI